MNLHKIVSSAIGSVNPFIPVQLWSNIGYTTRSEDGKQTPNYQGPYVVKGQVQELTQKDMRKLDGLNIQGVSTKIYLSGALTGVVRVLAKGGDKVAFSYRGAYQTFNVIEVLEQWPDWVSVGVILQNQ